MNKCEWCGDEAGQYGHRGCRKEAEVAKAKAAPKKGRVEIGGKGCFDSWVVGDWMIVEMTGSDVGARGSSKQKAAFLLRQLSTGKEHKIIPDYENDYDLNYALWYVKKLDGIGKA